MVSKRATNRAGKKTACTRQAEHTVLKARAPRRDSCMREVRMTTTRLCKGRRPSASGKRKRWLTSAAFFQGLQIAESSSRAPREKQTQNAEKGPLNAGKATSPHAWRVRVTRAWVLGHLVRARSDWSRRARKVRLLHCALDRSARGAPFRRRVRPAQAQQGLGLTSAASLNS